MQIETIYRVGGQEFNELEEAEHYFNQLETRAPLASIARRRGDYPDDEVWSMSYPQLLDFLDEMLRDYRVTPRAKVAE